MRLNVFSVIGHSVLRPGRRPSTNGFVHRMVHSPGPALPHLKKVDGSRYAADKRPGSCATVGSRPLLFDARPAPGAATGPVVGIVAELAGTLAIDTPLPGAAIHGGRAHGMFASVVGPELTESNRLQWISVGPTDMALP
jgi:hypothetical protein